MRIEVWRRKAQDMPLPLEPEQKLERAFEEMNQALEDLGHNPAGVLELRLPDNSIATDIVFRWHQS